MLAQGLGGDDDARQLGVLLQLWHNHGNWLRGLKVNDQPQARPPSEVDPTLARALADHWPIERSVARLDPVLQAHIYALRAMAAPPGAMARAALEQIGTTADGRLTGLVEELLARTALRAGDHASATSWAAHAAARAASATYLDTAVQGRLQRLQDDIVFAARNDVYGPVWTTWREAQVRVAYQSWTDALAFLASAEALANQAGVLCEPVLRAAIVIERLRILAAQDDTTAFVLAWKATTSEIVGPWWGEALIIAGDQLLEEGRFAEASTRYDQAEAWLSLRARKPSVDSTIPLRLQPVATPPADWRRPMGSGGRTPNEPEPGQLFMPESAAWYLPFHLTEVTARRALSAFLAGRVGDAVTIAGTLRMFDPEDRANTLKGMPSNERRLVDGFSTGGLFADNDTLGLVQKSYRGEFLLAELRFQMEHWSQADAAYQRLIRRRPDLGDDVIAYISVPRSLCIHFHRRDKAGSERILTEALQRFPRSKSTPRVLWELGDAVQDFSQKPAVLTRIFTEFPLSPYAFEAMVLLAEMQWVAGDRPAAEALYATALAKATTEDQKTTVEVSIRARKSFDQWKLEHPQPLQESP